MLDSHVAQKTLDYGLSFGADFTELFVEKNTTQNLSILSSKVDSLKTGIDFGIGIRLVFGTKVLYGYTNRTDADELMRITKLLASQDLRDPSVESSPLNFMSVHDQHPVVHGLRDKTAHEDQKIAFFMAADKAARAVSDKINQVNLSNTQRMQMVEIFNSEGLHTKDERNYIHLRFSAIAKDGSLQTTAGMSPGSLSGWEFTDKFNPLEIGEEVAKDALKKLKAVNCPAGKMPVIIDNAFGGVIFHESCGHLLETTSVAKKASVFYDKMGEMIASECVSAVDDGTIKNEWGSINIDDEGMKTQRTQLIKDGKLTSFMVDKLGSMKTGYERTGSARRQSYKFAPTSRMRNTFIEPGEHTLDEMISTIDHGIYCKKMGGGSVSPGTGEFNFVALEPYLIKNGKIAEILKPASLIGSGPQALKQISMVGNNFELAAGVCGSVSGAIPTTVGQGAIKVDEILVGGQG